MTKRTKTRRKPTAAAGSGEEDLRVWKLRLYIAGHSPKSLTAFSNLKRICEDHLKDQYHLEVIDLSKHPELARKDQILALPTLVRKLPTPMKKIIGDLSDKEKVLVGFDLKQGLS